MLLPWTVIETGAMCLLSRCSAMSWLHGPSEFRENSAFYPLFAFNIFFILITTAVYISITFFLARARFQDFTGLAPLARLQNRKLQDLDRLKPSSSPISATSCARRSRSFSVRRKRSPRRGIRWM